MRSAYESLLNGKGVDGSGNRIAYAGSLRVDELLVLDRATGERRRYEALGGFTISQQLSGTGQHYFRYGTIRTPMGLLLHTLRLDLASGITDTAPPVSPVLFRADRAGRRLAMTLRVDGDDRPSQYALYDFETKALTRLSDSPDAIDVDPDGQRCATIAGVPLITGDGGRVVVITPSSLGVAEAAGDPEQCKVLEYAVESGTWRLVSVLPADMTVLGYPALSDDGALLSFIASRPLAGGGSRTTPFLVSVSTGTLVPLPQALYDEPGFDSVITRDGAGLVVSSRADLDPLGGNADGNMELFLLHLANMRFEQVTFSTGGIGSAPNGCSSLDPSRNDDGSVLVFATPIFSIPPCNLDGPFRDQRTGMVLHRVRAVRKRQGNAEPTLDWRGPREVGVGQELVLRLSGRDSDGDPLTFYANHETDVFLPAGAELTQDGAEEATLRWTPGEEQLGGHAFRLALFDEGGGAVTADVPITVCASVYDQACREAVVRALFGDADTPCGDADVNGDGDRSAADFVAVAARAATCVAEAGRGGAAASAPASHRP